MINYEQLVQNALQQEKASTLVAGLTDSIFTQESGRGKNTKTSNQGAVGPMQIIPQTFKSFADKGWDISNPEHSARASIRYIQALEKQFGDNPRAVAAAYYGGPKAGNALLNGEAYRDLKNPNAPNTLQYADKVVSRMANWKPEKSAVPIPKEQAVQQQVQPMSVATSPPAQASTPIPRFGEGIDTRLSELNALINSQNQRTVPMEYVEAKPLQSDYVNPFWDNFKKLTGMY